MKECKHLYELKFLCEQLRHAAEAKPYDPMRYNRVIEKLEKAHSAHFRSRRRYPWSALISILILLGILLWLTYVILSFLWIRGTT